MSSTAILDAVDTADEVQFVYTTEPIAGITLVVACEGVFGAEVIDATTPSNITLLGPVPYPGGPRNIFVSGNYAYLAYHYGGVYILDITDPANPDSVSTILFPGNATYDVEVVGTTLYLCNFYDGAESGLFAYDVTTPSAPTLLGSYPLPEGSRAIAASAAGNYLILVHYYDGIYKFNITDPANIVPLGNADVVAGQPRDVRLRTSTTPNVAFVAAYNEDPEVGGVAIFNATDNALPLLSTYHMGRVRSCAFRTVGAARLYAGSEDEGLDIVNIVTIGSPVLLGHYDSAGDINGVVYGNGGTANHFVFLFSWENGIEMVNVTTGSDPILHDSEETHGLAKNGFIAGNYLYAADSYDFQIYSVDWSPVSVDDPVVNVTPDEYALFSNYPNPFNPVTNLTFHMKKAGNASITVYDVMGRQVAVVADDMFTSGVHEVQFDASSLSSGTYFANFVVDGFSQTQKMLLLK